jgi:hypothetical protein
VPISNSSFRTLGLTHETWSQLLALLDSFLRSHRRFVLELNKLDCTVIICVGVGDSQLRRLEQVPMSTATLSTWSLRLWKPFGNVGSTGNSSVDSGGPETPSTSNIQGFVKTFLP